MKNKKTIAPLSPLAVEILGRRELLISGCTGILHFSEEKIGVRTKSSSVWVSGASLTLCWAGDGKLMIKGRLDSVEYKGEDTE